MYINAFTLTFVPLETYQTGYDATAPRNKIKPPTVTRLAPFLGRTMLKMHHNFVMTFNFLNAANRPNSRPLISILPLEAFHTQHAQRSNVSLRRKTGSFGDVGSSYNVCQAPVECLKSAASADPC